MPKKLFYADEYVPDFGVPWPEVEPSKMDDEELKAHVAARLRIEEAAKVDPVTFGWTLPSWRMVMENWGKYNKHCILGGNRAGKTTFAARLIVDAAINIPEAKIRCWHVNEEKSIAEQQSLIWECLPARFKDMGRKKGVNFSIQYSQKNGFAGSKLILPPLPGYSKGSEIQFNFYQQYRNDAQIAEGWSSHLIWCDEECPQKLFETLQYRIVDMNGRIILTFTTLNGWTPLVADICARKKVLSKRYSTLLDREIPYEEESLSRAGMRLYYFWTEDNPFVPTKQFLQDLKSRSVEEKLARAFIVQGSETGSNEFDDFQKKLTATTENAKKVQDALDGIRIRMASGIATDADRALIPALTRQAAIAQAELFKRNVQRAQTLFEADVISAAELQRRENEYEVTATEMRAAMDQLRVLGMSSATIDRLLMPIRQASGSNNWRRPPRAYSAVRRRVPVRTFRGWEDHHEPGWLEIDLVAHCGGRMQGPFLWTLVATDIATGWSESVPILVRDGAVVLTALQLIRRQLPFPLRGIDADNLTMTVEAGCILQAVQTAAAEQALLFPFLLKMESWCMRVIASSLLRRPKCVKLVLG